MMLAAGDLYLHPADLCSQRRAGLSICGLALRILNWAQQFILVLNYRLRLVM